MVVLLEGRFFHLHRGTLELCQWPSGSRSPPWSRPFSPDYLVWPALGRVLVFPKFFHLRMMEATVFLGSFNAADIFGTLPRSLPRHNPVSELYRQLRWPDGLVIALKCTFNCGTLCRQVCAFPNHVQSIEFTTGGLQSSSRNISRMINWNRMHLSSISSLIAKDLNMYSMQIRYFCFLFLIHLQIIL